MYIENFVYEPPPSHHLWINLIIQHQIVDEWQMFYKLFTRMYVYRKLCISSTIYVPLINFGIKKPPTMWRFLINYFNIPCIANVNCFTLLGDGNDSLNLLSKIFSILSSFLLINIYNSFFALVAPT